MLVSVDGCSLPSTVSRGSQQAGQTRRARGPGRAGHPPWPARLARGLPLTVKGSDCLRVHGGEVRDGVQGVANCMISCFLALPQGHDGSYFCSSPSTPRDSDSPGAMTEAIFVLPQVSPGTPTPQGHDGSYFCSSQVPPGTPAPQDHDSTRPNQRQPPSSPT
jgi:hypothetical protein